MATVTKMKGGDAADAARAAPADAAEPVPVSGKAGIAIAMAQAFAKIEGATKGKLGQVGQQKYKYADLGSVIDAIKPALIAHDLFFVQRPVASDHGVTVNTVLHHASGEWMDLGELFVPANKNDAQGYGSALTYARRYALVTAFGVPVEDDDGNAAARGQSRGESAVSPSPLVSDAEWAAIVQLVEVTGTDAAKVCLGYKVDSLKALSAEQAADLKAILTKRLAAMKPETANA